MKKSSGCCSTVKAGRVHANNARIRLLFVMHVRQQSGNYSRKPKSMQAANEGCARHTKNDATRND